MLKRYKVYSTLFIIALIAVGGFLYLSQLNPQPVLAGGQNQPLFPEPQPTSRILARSRQVFKGYRDQGMLEFKTLTASSAELYINGHQLPIAAYFKEPQQTHRIPLGSYTVDGINTIKVLNVMPEGAQVSVNVLYPQLIAGQPEQVGFSPAKLHLVDELINREITAGFPGAVLLIAKNGRIIKHSAYGYRQQFSGEKLLTSPLPMTTDTMFDLASNTKAFAVNLALKKLVSEGRLELEAPISTYLPDFVGDGREAITLRQLISHRAGFAPDIRFFDPKLASLGLYERERLGIRALLNRIPLMYLPGTQTVYSDTGYIILGFIIEAVTGQQLDDYVEQTIYQPLGLTHTVFNPRDKGFSNSRFAATERLGNSRDGRINFPGIRRHTLSGEVHDEKAFYALNGVSGHAGLFSQAQELAVLAQLLLNGGGYGSYKLADNITVHKFTQATADDHHYSLGWDKNNIWEFGPYASSQAFGHTGWTGTAVMIDPQHELIVVLLTNKIHAPVTADDCDRFNSFQFETGKYGSIMSLIYEAFLELD